MQPVLLNKLRFLLWKHVEVSHGVGILREPELRGFVCALFDNGGNGLHGSRRELSRWWLPISGGYDVRVVLVLCNSIADIPLSKRDWDRAWPQLCPPCMQHGAAEDIVRPPTLLLDEIKVPSSLQLSIQQALVRNQKSRAGKRNEIKQRMRAETRLAASENKVAELQHQLTSLQRAPNTRFTVFGGLSAALRRTTSRVSASRFGIGLEFDVHHTTISTWELELDASLVAASRAFHADARLHQTAHAERLFSMLFWRSDATHADVWQRQKFNVCVGSAAYLTESSCSVDVQPEVSTKVADLIVQEGGTGRDSYAMSKKQLETLGFPSWTQAALPSEIQTFFCTTDAGPDQLKCRKLIRSMMKDDLFKLFFEISCFQHQGQLTAAFCLLRINILLTCWGSDIVYSSALATIMHVWRDSAVTMFNVWEEVGTDSCMAMFKKPCSCIKGRWGSYHNCECQLLSMPWGKFQSVFTSVTTKNQARCKAKIEPARVAAKSDDALEHIIALGGLEKEDTQFHQIKIWKYRAMAVKAVNDALFFIAMRVSQRIGAVLARFRHFLQSHNERVGRDAPGCFAVLSAGKAHAYLGEIEDLLDERAWEGVFGLVAEAADLSSQDAMEGIQWVVLGVAADFRRRIVVPCENLPYQLLIFGVHAQDTASKELALRLLLKSHDHDETTRKFAHHFKKELQQLVSDGSVHLVLWRYARTLGQMWRPDTEEVEGINSVLKTLITEAPNIGVPLLSARASTTKQCGLGHRRGSHKWSDISSAVVSVRNLALQYAPLRCSVQTVDRFSTPGPIPIAEIPEPLIQKRLPQLRVAASKCLEWARSEQFPNSPAALRMVTQVDGAIIIPVQKYGAFYVCIRCELYHDKIQIMRPLCWVSFEDVDVFGGDPRSFSYIQRALRWTGFAIGTTTSSVEVHLTKVRLMTDADVDNYIEAGHSEDPSAAPPTEPEHEMPFEDEFENDVSEQLVVPGECGPTIPLTESIIASLLSKWRAAYAEGCRSFGQLNDAVANKEIWENGELSLVRIKSLGDGTFISFMNWRSPNRRVGQIAMLDQQGRCKYSPPAMFQYKEYAASELDVLIPAIGAKMEKVTARFRPVVLASIVRLKRMVEVFDSGGWSAHPDLLVCRGCEACGSLCAALQCPVCLLHGHNECFLQVLGSRSRKRPRESLPNECRGMAGLRDVVCPLCK